MTLIQTADRAALIEELAQADFPLDVGYAEIAYTQELRKTGSERERRPEIGCAPGARNSDVGKSWILAHGCAHRRAIRARQP